MTGRTLFLSAALLAALVGTTHSRQSQAGTTPSGLEQLRTWQHAPARVEVRNEVSKAAADFVPALGAKETVHPLPAIGLSVAERWSAEGERVTWQLDFTSPGPRVGHEVTIELPLLSGGKRLFTPSQRGELSLAAYPTLTPQPYAHFGWDTNCYWVLPLMSIFDRQSDRALTVALSPEQNIPQLQFEWKDAKVLRLRLGHRAVGGGKPSPLMVTFFSHAADYRAALRAYSEAHPRYFRPVMPRTAYEGAFWYHHIHCHPDFAEMARQNIRFIWSSFWFTHLGEYLPAEKVWEPYTYARWWNMKETMSDEKIRAFAKKMHERGIGVFAYFNVTEYGGIGGRAGDTQEAARRLREQFADALMKDQAGNPIPTWEGAMAMNARRNAALFPALSEQVRRHLQRVPEIDGFIIDRLDWANVLDYGHDDGQTLVGQRPAENMVGPVSEGVGEVCRQAHAAGKRVYVNQFWRVEVLRDVDGYCHEADYVRGLGYLSPYRPVSAWHQEKPYQGDLLRFEAQLKMRLQFAVFPQMIAHEFPISQQPPNAKAADLLEIYAPLFAALDGKEQVLLPHCVEATGANDVNLFVNRDGNYVVPLTSRVRFLSRRSGVAEPVTVTLRVPGASSLRWAQVLSADGPPQAAAISHHDGRARVSVAKHQTASIVLIGRGNPPPLASGDSERLARLRDRLFPSSRNDSNDASIRPDLTAIKGAWLRVQGAEIETPSAVKLAVNGKPMGKAVDGTSAWPLPCAEGRTPDRPPVVYFETEDDGAWFVPERIEWIVETSQGKTLRVAEWSPRMSAEPQSTREQWSAQLAWRRPEEIQRAVATFVDRDITTGGDSAGKRGAHAKWIAQADAPGTQNGYALRIAAPPCVWAAETNDARAMRRDRSKNTGFASCWFETQQMSLSLTPPDSKEYRLSIYLLDFDRNGRSMEAVVRDGLCLLDKQSASRTETDRGVYLAWKVRGPVTIDLNKKEGFNAVLSGVFVD